MITLSVFIVLSILLYLFTILRTQRYRYYRFFAFESLLALVFINLDKWFYDPFSLIHMISWFFLLLSFIVALYGFILLKTAGSPKKDIEDTTILVYRGMYKYIRHPLYITLLIGGIGVFFKDPDPVGIFILLILCVFIYLTARVEEHENLQKFGSAYRDYMDKTKRFIPFLY